MTELLFPCEYPVKVIGNDDPKFINFVTAVISQHVPGLPLDAFSERRSSTGKYVSISVTFVAESRAQVDALYEALGEDKRVRVAL